MLGIERLPGQEVCINPVTRCVGNQPILEVLEEGHLALTLIEGAEGGELRVVFLGFSVSGLGVRVGTLRWPSSRVRSGSGV